MASLKEMRSRIASVKSTQKITKAIQMVAAAKLRRSQEAAEKARPYAQRMAAVIANLAAGDPSAHRTVRRRRAERADGRMSGHQLYDALGRPIDVLFLEFSEPIAHTAKPEDMFGYRLGDSSAAIAIVPSGALWEGDSAAVTLVCVQSQLS